jgi:hypothetical protein
MPPKENATRGGRRHVNAFWLVSEGAGVNAKASRLQMPRLWNLGLVAQTGSYLRQAVALEAVTEVPLCCNQR